MWLRDAHDPQLINNWAATGAGRSPSRAGSMRNETDLIGP